jgi:membrane protease YdiL (CAAX protease family)
LAEQFWAGERGQEREWAEAKAMSMLEHVPGEPFDSSDQAGANYKAAEQSPTPAATPPDAASAPLAGDPTYAASAPASPPQKTGRILPDDIRIPWSWGHFLIFMFFTFTSFIVVQTALAVYYVPPHQHLSKQQLEHYLLNKPQFLFGSNLIWYGLIFLFLYVTLSVLRDLSFWNTLGWRSLKPDSTGHTRSPWVYFFCGCGLAVFVAVASSQIHTPENTPIQELLKSRQSALLLMCMAVVVAPLVEETVFRGYLYPLFAKSFGIAPAVMVTGILFGLMHGSQLGWSWGIVALLALVGVIFTFARAYTGTVLASFLLHLGYNSAIAVTTILSTHGFTRAPNLH